MVHNAIYNINFNYMRLGILMDGNLYFVPGGISRHSEKKANGEKYNENNSGAGLIYEWTDPETGKKKYFTGGMYNNSLGKDSYYVGGGIKNRLLGSNDLYLDGGIIGGAMTGYNDSVVPALMPTLSLGNRLGAINLMYVPKIDGVTPETYMLNSQWKLK